MSDLEICPRYQHVVLILDNYHHIWTYLLYVEKGLLLLPYQGSFRESPALPS
jgi:hypothetical protein